jgi:hypothetical protein
VIISNHGGRQFRNYRVEQVPESPELWTIKTLEPDENFKNTFDGYSGNNPE